MSFLLEFNRIYILSYVLDFFKLITLIKNMKSLTQMIYHYGVDKKQRKSSFEKYKLRRNAI